MPGYRSEKITVAAASRRQPVSAARRQHVRSEYQYLLAFEPESGIPTQVVKPSVSRAAVPHGTAFTVFVVPSGSTMTRPVPVSTVGSGPVEYGFDGPGGPYAPVYLSDEPSTCPCGVGADRGVRTLVR